MPCRTVSPFPELRGGIAVRNGADVIAPALTENRPPIEEVSRNMHPEKSGLSVLITNIQLDGRTGTELVVRDLALGLRSAGHDPMIYSPRHGDIARELAQAGIPVVGDLAALPAEPEVIHGHHHVETVAAVLRFPQARAIFVCHDRLAWHDVPPLLPGIERYVAVDYNCRERLVWDYGIPEARTRVIHNWVDTDRFQPREPLPPEPRRALVFSNYATRSTHLSAIQAACDECGISVDVAGLSAGRSLAEPERVLGDYDLVFAKAKCAMEAMACGAAVILCDTVGLGPMVTSGEVERLRCWNFGMRLLTGELTSENVREQILRYDPVDAVRVRDYIRGRAGLAQSLDQYLTLYREILAEPPRVRNQSDFTAVWTSYRNYLSRMAKFEQELYQFRNHPGRMLPLSVEELRFFRVSPTGVPGEVRAGTPFEAQVLAENLGTAVLENQPPCPVNFSYRWLTAGTRWPLNLYADRTAVKPALRPTEKRHYWIAVKAPPDPGQYILRVTLVQEKVGWFDQAPNPVYADVPVSVI